MTEQVLHNGLNTRSNGKGRGGKVAPCGVPLTRANSAQKLRDITCQRCLSSLAVRDRDTADVRRDAAKSARDVSAADRLRATGEPADAVVADLLFGRKS